MNVRDLIREAAVYGATVERDDGGDRWETYQVIAPRGRVWSEGHVHALCVSWDTKQPGVSKQMRDEAIKDALQRMGDGTEPCDDIDCDDCAPEPNTVLP